MGEKNFRRSRRLSCPVAQAAAAHLHWARTVSRRAERLVVRLAASEPIRGEVIRYMNRLSDGACSRRRADREPPGRSSDVTWKPSG